MSTNLTLTARELELLKEVGKHLQTASVSQLPLPASSLSCISLNKAPLPNNFHSLTHSLTYALNQVDWSSVAQNINYKTPKAARDKWYPLRDKLFGGAAESTNNNSTSSSNKKGGGGGKDFATTPLRAKKRKFGEFLFFRVARRMDNRTNSEIVHVNYHDGNNDEDDDDEVKQEEEQGTPSRMKISKKIFKAKATDKGKKAENEAENEEDEVKVKPERVDNEDEDDEDENEDGYLF